MAFTHNNLHRQIGGSVMPKILVPLDGSKLSERALNQAETFAKALQADVILVRVIENPLAATPEVGPPFEKR
jgi:nucleotide-binding universal stress UspA family protein